jgi:hypothetical protein
VHSLGDLACQAVHGQWARAALEENLQSAFDAGYTNLLADDVMLGWGWTAEGVLARLGSVAQFNMTAPSNLTTPQGLWCKTCDSGALGAGQCLQNQPILDACQGKAECAIQVEGEAVFGLEINPETFPHKPVRADECFGEAEKSLVVRYQCQAPACQAAGGQLLKVCRVHSEAQCPFEWGRLDEPASAESASSAVCSEPLFYAVSEQQLTNADGNPANLTSDSSWLVDWNSDGFDDMVELLADNTTLNWWLGSAEGFQAAAAATVVERSMHEYLADLNTDDLVDWVTVSGGNAQEEAFLSWNLAAVPDRFEATESATVHQPEDVVCFEDVDQSKAVVCDEL